MSNVSLTCPEDGDSCPKGQVIPGKTTIPHGMVLKGRKALWERAISYQLVGRVTAYQGDDA